MNAEKKNFYGWILLVAIGIMFLCSSGFILVGASVVNPLMMADSSMNMNATLMGLGFTLFVLCQGIPAPLIGQFITKYGQKKTFIVGGLLLIIGGLLMAFVVKTTIGYLIAFGVILSIGSQMAGQVTMQTSVSAWFVQKRALAMSIATVIGAIGSFISPRMQIYTSGTTSIPKGVMLSDNAICSHALGHLTDICQTGNSVYMCVLPLFHASSSGAIATLIAGATVVVLERFRPKVYLKTIEKYKATALSLTPSMFSALLDEIDEGSYDLTSVKSVIYGAEPILAKYIRKANEKLGCDFYQLFGMSEMGPVITLLRAEDHRAKDDALLEKRLKSVGKVALGAKIKIVAPDGSKCPVGRQGEIYAQGLGQMMCYYNAPDKTASVFSDGWYHTGDVGYLDEDNYLYLVGRMSDMIISGGENVYPKSVEECILALDGVENVAVVGLKDDHLGEAVTAVIVKAPGAELDEATVRNWCKGKIAGFMKPRKVFFVNELPVNSTGKIDKRKLTEMFN